MVKRPRCPKYGVTDNLVAAGDSTDANRVVDKNIFAEVVFGLATRATLGSPTRRAYRSSNTLLL
jgi:hypothetical protein